MPQQFKPPRIHLILAQNVAKELPFEKLYTKTNCPNEDSKVSPYLLVIDREPVLKYNDFIAVFQDKHNLLDPCVSHLILGSQETREQGEGMLEYLVFFAKGVGEKFHEEASEIIKKTACFTRISSLQKEET